MPLTVYYISCKHANAQRHMYLYVARLVDLTLQELHCCCVEPHSHLAIKSVTSLSFQQQQRGRFPHLTIANDTHHAYLHSLTCMTASLKCFVLETKRLDNTAEACLKQTADRARRASKPSRYVCDVPQHGCLLRNLQPSCPPEWNTAQRRGTGHNDSVRGTVGLMPPFSCIPRGAWITSSGAFLDGVLYARAVDTGSALRAEVGRFFSAPSENIATCSRSAESKRNPSLSAGSENSAGIQ